MILVFGNCFISCTTFTPTITVGNNFNNINLLSGACDNENHVYFINRDKRIMKMSKETGSVTDMGVSTHYLGDLNIVDGYLYLSTADYSHGDVVSVTPCRINLNDIKDITYFNDYEKTGVSSFDGPAIIIDDMIYFNGRQKINKDGTGEAAIDDNPYRVIGVENNSIYAYIDYITDDDIIIENGLSKSMAWVYKLSPKWDIEKKLFQISINTQGFVTFMAAFGEYVYYTEPGEVGSDDYFHEYKICRNRLSESSEKEILIELEANYARILAVTEDGVYFYYTYGEETTLLSNIHRINRDGNDIEELPFKYDVYNFEEESYYFVSNIDGKLYGIINNKILPIE